MPSRMRLGSASLSLVLLLCLAHGSTAASHNKGNDITRMLMDRVLNWNVLNQDPLLSHHVDPASVQPVHLIVAGLPRTGTTSFEAAAQRLGLKTYNMQKLSQTMGHIKLWHDYYVEGRNNETLDTIIDSVAANGYNATAGAAMFHYDYLMKKYPDALVIQTVRSEDDAGAAWTRSASNTALSLLPVMNEIPFRYVPALRTFARMMTTMLNTNFAPMDPETGLPDVKYLPQHYDAWCRRIQQTVPKEKLLVFRARDGWEPLCNFLSPSFPVIASNCQDILASNEPYPRVNDSGNFQTAVTACRWIQFVCFRVLPVVAVASALVVLAYVTGYFSSSSRSKKQLFTSSGTKKTD